MFPFFMCHGHGNRIVLYMDICWTFILGTRAPLDSLVKNNLLQRRQNISTKFRVRLCTASIIRYADIQGPLQAQNTFPMKLK
jgi:hypothetical protein